MNCIKNNGTKLDVYRVEYFFYGKRNDDVPLQILSEKQNEDGGFPYTLEKGNVSSMSETSVQFTRLDELDLLKSNVGKRVVEYFIKKQRDDGRWGEDPEILQYNPPPWRRPEDLKSDMWLTAQIALHMLEVGHQEEARKAAHFLMNNREGERFIGYNLTTILCVSLFSRLGKEDVTKNMEAVVKEIVENEEEPAFLNWYIETLESSTLSYKEALIEKSLEKLQKRLEEITVFESVNGEQWNIPNTISSLKLLKRYDKLD